ncbi:hypothetical protein GY21_09055 [Cryobacterium roopkundense]|uniref:Transglutaminase-like domain-containing protein n=1 Tax=Cryobacterium roopkundense TaxID=1001240 RepID=A0A099JFA0_9MICO|nr:hypothetical protein GY21_09055 [Cryobacterium roopkundense]
MSLGAGHTVALLFATIAACVTLWPVYQSREFIVLVGAAFALGAVIAVGGALFRWPAWLVILVTLAGFLVTGVPLAVPGRAVDGLWPSVPGLVDLLAASALSWKQLVTIVLPVGSYQTLLVPALILVLASTVIGLSTALRARTPELAVIAPGMLFVAGIALGPAVDFFPLLSGLGFFLTVLVWLLWMRHERRDSALRLAAGVLDAPSRPAQAARGDSLHATAPAVLSATAILLTAASIGALAAVAVPAQADRDVLRTRVQQPFDPLDYSSPLSEFRSYLQPARADEPLLEVEGLPRGGRLRLAALDTYDGIVYSVGDSGTRSVSGAFTRLPYRLDQSVVAGEQTTLSVTVEGYTGVWVPGSGQLEQIDFRGSTSVARSDSFYYNDAGASAAVISGLTRGDRYVSESVTPLPVADLEALRPGSAVQPPLGLVPDRLVQALDGYARGDDAPGVRLRDALDGLARDGYVSHGIASDEPISRSGHGADRITQLFTDVPMIGDQEQYAVAAALMARQIGFPARVVVGFAPDPGRTGAVQVTGADMSAWIEVQSSEGAWVTIDPTPIRRDIPRNQPDEPTIVSRPQSVLPPPAVDTPQQRDPEPAERTVEEPAVGLSPLLAFLLAAATVAGWTLLGLAVALSPFLFVVAAKARRRRLRRTRPDPRDRMSGGWHEFVDAAADSGIELPVRATRLELAGTVSGSIRGTHAHVLAVAVDRALFSPDTTSRADSDAAWGAVDHLRRQLMEGKSRWERLRAFLSVRSFGRYSGGRRTKEGQRS